MTKSNNPFKQDDDNKLDGGKSKTDIEREEASLNERAKAEEAEIVKLEAKELEERKRIKAEKDELKAKEAEKSKARVEKETKKLREELEKEMQECHEKANVIVSLHGSESEIPLSSEYWPLMSRYRTIRKTLSSH